MSLCLCVLGVCVCVMVTWSSSAKLPWRYISLRCPTMLFFPLTSSNLYFPLTVGSNRYCNNWSEPDKNVCKWKSCHLVVNPVVRRSFDWLVFLISERHWGKIKAIFLYVLPLKGVLIFLILEKPVLREPARKKMGVQTLLCATTVVFTSTMVALTKLDKRSQRMGVDEAARQNQEQGKQKHESVCHIKC